MWGSTPVTAASSDSRQYIREWVCVKTVIHGPKPYKCRNSGKRLLGGATKCMGHASKGGWGID